MQLVLFLLLIQITFEHLGGIFFQALEIFMGDEIFGILLLFRLRRSRWCRECSEWEFGRIGIPLQVGIKGAGSAYRIASVLEQP
jgi:hypothetical protein